jgi:Rrf2 family protein
MFIMHLSQQWCIFVNKADKQSNKNHPRADPMKLSTKTRYGVRAAIELARAYASGPIKRKDIASSQAISDAYLENILILLKNGRIINAIRGANGGYALSRAPAKVTLLEVVDALEGTEAPVECIDNADVCERSTGCLARDVWKQLHEARAKVLSGITLQSLLEKENGCDKVDYSI